MVFNYSAIMYAVALSITAVISLLSKMLIWQYLSRQTDGSDIINIAAGLKTYRDTMCVLPMKERAALPGRILSVFSIPGTGTTVQLEIPL